MPVCQVNILVFGLANGGGPIGKANELISSVAVVEDRNRYLARGLFGASAPANYSPAYPIVRGKMEVGMSWAAIKNTHIGLHGSHPIRYAPVLEHHGRRCPSL